MPLVILDPLTDVRWTNFINEFKEASIFHHPSWSRLIGECYGYRDFVVALTNDDEQIIAGTPMMEVKSWLTGNRWISLPFTDHCKPLAHNMFAFEALLNELTILQVNKQIPKMEIRWATPLNSGFYQNSTCVLHLLKLEPDPELMFMRLKKTQFGRNIARSQREGVKVEWAQTPGDMNKFYRLHLLTRKHQGIPTQPKRYFDQLWEQLLNKQLGFLLLAYKGTEVIAGAVFLNWNGILIYKYGASDRQNLSLRPNHAIFSTAIRWGSTNDCRLLDFGKTDIENQGLREFKSGWGANEEPLINSFLGDKPKGMGNGITNLVMNKIVRNTPPFTTRAFGEILYRHFA